MNLLPTTQEQLVLVQNNEPMTTSKIIAAHFGKAHSDVLKAIKNLDCPKLFTDGNFAVSEYSDPTGRKLPMYLITEDGFMFLAMGFTGKKATQFKIEFIMAFRKLIQLLNQQQQALTNQTISDQQELIALQREKLKHVMRFWTPDEAKTVLELYFNRHQSIRRVADHLGRSYNSTQKYIARIRHAMEDK